MIIKCKMCGGDLEFTPGATYGTCEYCGSTSTIPQAEDENKLNRYNRANHFRRQCEFDKAVAAYEKILEADDTDAEAHWGAVISRYGIEYVEDPATGKRVPTCHRVQVASILADADYLAAVENAPDAASRDLYKQQAAEIAEIQKGILAISANEKPYDVFICYKETDANGQRTHDSQWAQDVYYGLTEQGYKVFFSRITLEDKLGQEYEPYIFAALNSARVMVVIGSRPEYFSAVWVKNEWSRYLALMAKDRKRLLIPCYRDMDPYDLPEELSSLQSQDMSKIGFMQDLLRGIRKVLEAEKKPEQPKVIQQTVQAAASDAGAPGVVSLMKRVKLFMEDGDFKSAAEYLDRVLDLDPEFSAAYAAKVCVAFEFHREAELADATFLYEDNADWQKALRFATPQQKAVYEGYIARVKERVAEQISTYAYDCAIEMAVNPRADAKQLVNELTAYRACCTRSAGYHADGSRREKASENEAAFERTVKSNEPGSISEQGYKDAAEMFRGIKDEIAAARVKECLALAEQARQKRIYDDALRTYHSSGDDLVRLEQAAKVFLSVPEYKDARAKAQKCLEEAEAIRAKRYNNAVNAMKSAGEHSTKWYKAKICLAVNKLDHYRDVEALRAQAAKRYDECVAAEKEAKRQQEEAERQQEEAERRAKEAAAAKKKRGIVIGIIAAVLAIAALIVVTKVIIPGGKYSDAVALQQAGKYEEAIAAFEALGDYSDSEAQITACKNAIKEQDYQAAVALQQAGKYEEAISAFEALGDYKDCDEQITETNYLKAVALQQAGKYEEAIAAFEALGDYKDCGEQIKETNYLKAKSLLEKKDYAGAYAIFINLKGYKDVDNLLSTDENLKAAAREAKLKPYKTVGSYVTYGTYPQTEAGNDSTPIEWLVLDYDTKNNKALLISRYGLDCQKYNNSWTDVTWETCSLRTWLNGTFLNKAFSKEEQGAILTTNVGNSSSQCYSGYIAYGGNNTQDKIFLLSYAEANKYFNVQHYSVSGADKNTKSRVAPTAYAKAQGAWTASSYKTEDGSASGRWWLRSPGYNQSYAADMGTDGSLYYYSVNSSDLSVRPAFWLDLSGI